jgi:hypothetical protein
VTNLRLDIAEAIVRAFERTYDEHHISYDPDTCYEAADEVIAVLTTKFTGQETEAVFPRPLIGPARFQFR